MFFELLVIFFNFKKFRGRSYNSLTPSGYATSSSRNSSISGSSNSSTHVRRFRIMTHPKVCTYIITTQTWIYRNLHFVFLDQCYVIGTQYISYLHEGKQTQISVACFFFTNIDTLWFLFMFNVPIFLRQFWKYLVVKHVFW